jgi:hypothetical protein
MMAFDGVDNNVQHLVVTASVKGMEPLLPTINEEAGYKAQLRLFQFSGLINLTLADSVIQGLAPLTTSSPEGDARLNPAVPDPQSKTEEERQARLAKWANHVRVQNCTFSDTALALVGNSTGGPPPVFGEDDSLSDDPIVGTRNKACMFILGSMYQLAWRSHVEFINTRFLDINTSAPPGSRFQLHMLCIKTSNNNDTVVLRDSTFSNIQDALGDSLQLFEQSAVMYTGGVDTIPRLFTMQRCHFINVKGALLGALRMPAVVIEDCSVSGAQLAWGGFAFLHNMGQMVNITNSNFTNIQLGQTYQLPAGSPRPTGLNQRSYNPGVGLLKSSAAASMEVKGCMFRNISVLPTVNPLGALGNTSQQAAGSAAVIAAGADTRVAQSTFEECFTPAVVYAFSKKWQKAGAQSSTIGNQYNTRAVVSLVLYEASFAGNVYGVYANGYQVIISGCNFTASNMSGVQVSEVPSLVMNMTALQAASVSVQRASTAFGLSLALWFPLWMDANVEGAGLNVPINTRDAAVLQKTSSKWVGTFDEAVSVYVDSVNITGVQGRPALSLVEVDKASLSRVRIFDSIGKGALQANTVSGLSMVQCHLHNHSATQAADAVIAGGGTFTAVRSLYLIETVFSGNVGHAAGAMLLQLCGPVVMNSCTYIGNNASQNGGAVRAIASESIILDTSVLHQSNDSYETGVRECMWADVQPVVSGEMFPVWLKATCSVPNYLIRGSNDFPFDINAVELQKDPTKKVVCPQVFRTSLLLGGRVTTFSSNVAGASGGAVAIEGLTLATFTATQVNLTGNR